MKTKQVAPKVILNLKDHYVDSIGAGIGLLRLKVFFKKRRGDMG